MSTSFKLMNSGSHDISTWNYHFNPKCFILLFILYFFSFSCSFFFMSFIFFFSNSFFFSFLLLFFYIFLLCFSLHFLVFLLFLSFIFVFFHQSLNMENKASKHLALTIKHQVSFWIDHEVYKIEVGAWSIE